ncbi:gamma-glutamyltranspeptidase/glutathione hydrolase [Tamaricihabitans halophyticus]|uniref:Glutathione hydrolase proenzyme n=1 Tax=Tamaricihabitans halophyticus TaxID=1262583 RepID=A0A4R2QBF8_9PSEU|nr:gamma-glutamyltransferase [Tamaricihabitans halophyticus]TCP46320.1 gamma-glutamyltranspeptidase/glutathione hydrolase [Tamaricihabitans halophyticus]
MAARTLAAAVLTIGLAAGLAPAAAQADSNGLPDRAKRPVAEGFGGAVSSVDEDATKAGLAVLKRGGNAVDAAVATAAALGVTEPYSAGIGGGGYFVYYDAASRSVQAIDGRETAPAAMTEDSFVDPETGEVISFDEAVTSGLSVGVPGTPLTWERALANWGRLDLRKNLAPATKLAEQGFVVDEEFHGQTAANHERFAAFDSTAELFLPDGQPPAVGSTLRNPDLAETYRLLGEQGTSALYDGDLGADVARTVQQPPVAADTDLIVRPGLMEPADLAAYTAPDREPTGVRYGGVDVYSMPPTSSGGIAVGEALNILDGFDLSTMDRTAQWHHYLEASKLAYADRNAYVADPEFVDVPTDTLLSKEFAASRACLIDPNVAAPAPVEPGQLDGGDCTSSGAGAPQPYEGTSTTHLVTADAWGNVVSYTLTIEQTGGSGIVVPDRGFLLNNELTDFTIDPAEGGPNLPEPGKRPRSSMSPTIVLENGRPKLALGSPGGATIITTVLQTLLNRFDLGMNLPDAVAAPRMSQRNDEVTYAEQGILDSPERQRLEELGHRFEPAPADFSPNPELGAVAALEMLGHGKVRAVAEPERRGGGSAEVLIPTG